MQNNCIGSATGTSLQLLRQEKKINVCLVTMQNITVITRYIYKKSLVTMQNKISDNTLVSTAAYHVTKFEKKYLWIYLYFLPVTSYNSLQTKSIGYFLSLLTVPNRIVTHFSESKCTKPSRYSYFPKY